MLFDWSFWLDDYIAGALLLWAWWAGRKRAFASRPYLMAAWGYTFGMAYMSFFGQVRDTILTDPSGASREAVLAFKGLGLALAVACLVLSWFAKDDELSKTK